MSTKSPENEMSQTPVPCAMDEGQRDDRIVVRSYPKLIVFYPTVAVALFAGVVCAVLPNRVTLQYLVSIAFLTVLLLNTFVLTFDFPRMTAIALMLLIAALALALVLLEHYFDVLGPALSILRRFDPHANSQFYMFFSGIYALVYTVMWFVTRFDYWEISPNELLHHHGPFGDLERFPAPNLKLDKEITDVFEYAILRSGRLVLYPAGERRAIVLDNVLSVNRAETRIKDLLGTMDVRVDSSRYRS